MPFLRFSRDKRGYEHTYLVQATNRRGKPIRPRILYWYRTPPGVKLGRAPFDEEVRRMLEAQNPGIAFDWEALASTPFPSQEPEYWRERRRAERAAKQARRDEESTEDVDDAELAAAGIVEAPGPADESTTDDIVEVGSNQSAEPTPDVSPVRGEAPPVEGVPTKRRRRGGRRRRGRPANGQTGPAAPPPDGHGATASDPDSADADDPSNGDGFASEE